MAQSQPPLTWQASTDSNNTSVSDRLPEEVATCLQNARFLHLATCTANIPHVSLMNYTYLPSHPFEAGRLPPGPVIIMTSNSSSKKTINLQSNPNVSLLVHDWVSARPPNAGGRERSPVGTRTQRSSLANMLMQMNSTAVSNISTTINGEARILESGSEEERWCKEQHVVNNTFEDESNGQGLFRTSSEDDPQARTSLIEDQQARVVVVRIRDGRISDWKGGIKDWVVADSSPLVNGVPTH
ncbi:hypothetical protein AMS68_004737 [Peltaster fructicola]|uniref:Pyridoxamine 5'-phosphate oxidase N-terminal domain-containing protein n=1 Tax=Peltaster fructicola TaxID=286661 RepID=A0A6H0XXS4_9PEZI|nr:hypothetical protein AMS68_004737 [Peltaster fructicola]